MKQLILNKDKDLQRHFKQSKGKSTKIVITLLILALLTLAGYVAVDYLNKLEQEKQAQEDKIFNNGTTYGYITAYTELRDLLVQCKTFTMPDPQRNRNVTAVIIECLELNDGEGSLNSREAKD